MAANRKGVYTLYFMTGTSSASSLATYSILDKLEKII